MYLTSAAFYLNSFSELNELKTRPIEKYVNIEGETNKKLSVNVQESYADHPLVVGPRYQPKDVRVTWCTYLSSLSTGVMRKIQSI